MRKNPSKPEAEHVIASRFPIFAFVAPDFSVSCECRKITMGNEKEGVVSRARWSAAMLFTLL